MKTTPLLLFLLFATTVAINAQNPHLDYKVGLKLYNQSSFHKTTNSIPGQSQITDRNYQIMHPTAAVLWRNSLGNFHEAELTELNWNRKETPKVSNNLPGFPYLSQTYTTRISARYEYIIPFAKAKEQKLVPSLGFAVGPHFNRQFIRNFYSSSSSSTVTALGARIFVVPRLNYYFNSRVFADLNIPVCLADAEHNTLTRGDNMGTGLTESASELSFNMFPKYLSARIGIGIKI